MIPENKFDREELEKALALKKQAREARGVQPIKAKDAKGYLIAMGVEILFMLMIAKLNSNLLLLTIGVFTLTVWAFMKKNGGIRRDAPSAVVPLFGITFIVYPVIILLGDLATGGLDDKVKQIIGCFTVLIISTGSYFMIKRNENQLKYVCSAVVNAKCIALDKDLSGRSNRPIYAPMWEFELHGKVYRTLENVHSTNPKASVGEVQEIYVDPNDPTTMYRPAGSILKSSRAVCGILSIASIIITVIAIIR